MKKALKALADCEARIEAYAAGGCSLEDAKSALAALSVELAGIGREHSLLLRRYALQMFLDVVHAEDAGQCEVYRVLEQISRTSTTTVGVWTRTPLTNDQERRQ